MEERTKKSFDFIKTILMLDEVRDLEKYDDQGVKVTDHTYDVLDIAIKIIKNKYNTLEEAKKYLDFFVINVSVIIHDISKGSIRKSSEELSHSQMMKKNPEYIVKEVFETLEKVESLTGYFLRDDIKNNIAHVVLTHHGKWGKYQPETDEAKIVHKADMESATLHRINPINANDILELVHKGMTLDEVEVELNCSSTVIKDRLKRSKRIVRVLTNKELYEIYKEKGEVPIGDEFFETRSKETKELKEKMEESGFLNLMLTNPLLEYIDDEKIFKN